MMRAEEQRERARAVVARLRMSDAELAAEKRAATIAAARERALAAIAGGDADAVLDAVAGTAYSLLPPEEYLKIHRDLTSGDVARAARALAWLGVELPQ
jgi:hypothetical protein